jgi:pyruvate formate lyase activating enzyme
MKDADAALFDRLENGVIQCQICARRCLLRESQKGVCGVRQIINGELRSLSYGAIISTAIDPIEKKPLVNFLPKTKTFSVATPGCGMRCPWCQNYWLLNPDLIYSAQQLSPKEVAKLAQKSSCPSFSFTYSEPTVSLEFVNDCFREVKALGLKTVLVTNGNLTERSRSYLLPHLDAANVDVKTYDAKEYRKIGGDLSLIMDTIRHWIQAGVHVEITTLIIPGYNDDRERFRELCRRLKMTLGTDIIWHLNAFHPAHLFSHLPPTPVSTIFQLGDIALDVGFKNVHFGNMGVVRW